MLPTADETTQGHRQGQATVLFDGVCHLCTTSVQFIIQRDPQGYFTFASLQSPLGQHLLAAHGIKPRAVDSFVVLERSTYWVRSDAVLHVVRHLTGWWPVLTLLTLLPRPLRDWLYTCLARNRYRWFGQRPTCMLPTPALRDRFLGPAAGE